MILSDVMLMISNAAVTAKMYFLILFDAQHWDRDIFSGGAIGP